MLIQSVNNQAPISQPVARSGGDTPVAATGTADTSAVQSTAQSNVQQPTPEQLKSAVHTINQALQQSGQSLAFSIDSATKMTVVKLTDTSTGEILRQFPTQQTLAISQSIEQYQQGMLLTQKA